MKLDFHKLVGTGNDFVFIKHDQVPEKTKAPPLARHLCDRKWGIGADGLVIIKTNTNTDPRFSWNFYNSDGSQAAMCGNALRCAALYFKEVYQVENFQLETFMGIVKGTYRSGNCEAQWEVKNETPFKKTLHLGTNQNIQGEFIDTGVPHFVVLDNGCLLDKSLCLLIQNAPDFAPHKTNVTLLTRDDRKGHQTKSFERGVKDFTLACGTGVIASALVLKKLFGQGEYVFQTPGGQLGVKLEGRTVTLTGSAQISFAGTMNLHQPDL